MFCVFSQGHPEHGNYQEYRYDEIPERQEAEGGNSDLHGDQQGYPTHYHYPHHHHHHGYYGDTYGDENHPRADNPSYNTLPHSQGYHSVQTDQGYHTAMTNTVLSDTSKVPSHDYHVTASQPQSVRSSHDQPQSVRSSHDHLQSMRSSNEQIQNLRSSQEQLQGVRSSHDPLRSSHDPLRSSHDPLRSSHDPDSIPSHPLSPQKQSDYKVQYRGAKHGSDSDEEEEGGAKRRKTEPDTAAKPDGMYSLSLY